MRLGMLNMVLQLGTIALLLLFVAVFWREQQIQEEQEEKGGFCGVVAPTFVRTYRPPEGMEADVSRGKHIWNENACGSCHKKDMKTDATGPALAEVTERWADYPKADLYNWVRNSTALIDSGHPKAVALYDEWKTVMQSYPNLSDQDIEHLLAYIEAKYIIY